MTLGEMYQKYKMFICEYKGSLVMRSQVEDGHALITDREGHSFNIPFTSEVIIVGGKFYVGDSELKFALRRTIIDPELLTQAELTGGYIPLDIRNKKRNNQ